MTGTILIDSLNDATYFEPVYITSETTVTVDIGQNARYILLEGYTTGSQTGIRTIHDSFLMPVDWILFGNVYNLKIRTRLCSSPDGSARTIIAMCEYVDATHIQITTSSRTSLNCRVSVIS